MKPLALKPILSNLSEAHRELRWLFARMQFVIFGEVDDERVKDLAENAAREETRNPLTNEAVFFAMSSAYRHLNVAWNSRHASEERILRCAPADLARWSAFPKSAAFRNLWPSPSRCWKAPRKSIRGGRAPNSLQAAFLQMAVRKLDILRYKVAQALGKDALEEVPRPKGLYPEVEAEVFTEKVFCRRIHRIYREMNATWTYRKRTRSGNLSRQTIRRRDQFPCVFMSSLASEFRATKPLPAGLPSGDVRGSARRDVP